MSKEEKLEMIQEAAAEALELIGQAREAIEAAERETGYRFDHRITQELGEQYIGSVANTLVDIADGEIDDFEDEDEPEAISA